MRIAICAAFPQELKYIIRNFAATRHPQKSRFPVFVATLPRHELFIVQTGMGAANAEAALRFALDTFAPDTVLFLGFGGALYANARIGDLVWVNSVMELFGKTVKPLAIPDPAGVEEKLSARIRLLRGNVVTLSNRTEKKEILEILPPALSHAVCDMETYPAAKFCVEKDVLFYAIRAITDTLEEEIPPELFTVTDDFGKYELSRALGTILTRPHLIPHVIRLGRNSETAATLLYACAKLFVGIP